MPTLTTNLGLNKPVVASPADADLWGGQLNTNSDTLDSVIYESAETITSTDTIVKADFNKTFKVDATSGNITINFAAASALGNGWTATFIRVDNSSNTVTLDPNSSETINGASTYVLSGQYNAIKVTCDGSNLFLNSGIVSVGTANLQDASVTKTKLATSVFASQSEMETATANDVAVTPGRTVNHPGVAKFWAFFNSSGSLQYGYNVASVTRNSTGNYTVTLTNAFSSANYVVIASIKDQGAYTSVDASSQSAGSFVLQTFDLNGSLDLGCYVVGYGDQ